MSRHASPFLAHLVRCAAAVLVLVAPLARAQTIADYSRAQRALLENAMAQAAARSAGAGAPAPAAAVSAPVVPPPPNAHARDASPQPDVQVSGVFASDAGAVAEVVVDGTPYLLAIGESVPGTAWRVEATAVDRVVLARRGAGPGPGATAALRVFALPALR